MTVGARQDDGKRAGDAHKKAAIPRFPGNGGQRFPVIAYFRVRRMTFLQVAVQVRLCRAR